MTCIDHLPKTWVRQSARLDAMPGMVAYTWPVTTQKRDLYGWGERGVYGGAGRDETCNANDLQNPHPIETRRQRILSLEREQFLAIGDGGKCS